MEGVFEARIGGVRGRGASDKVAAAVEKVADSFRSSGAFFIKGAPTVEGRTFRLRAGYRTATGDASDVRRKIERTALSALPAGATIAVERVA